jgi:hypothetical protein
VQLTEKTLAPAGLGAEAPLSASLGLLGTTLALWPMTYAALKIVSHLTAGASDPATHVLAGPASYADWALGSLALAALFATSFAASAKARWAWPITVLSVLILALQTLLAP